MKISQMLKLKNSWEVAVDRAETIFNGFCNKMMNKISDYKKQKAKELASLSLDAGVFRHKANAEQSFVFANIPTSTSHNQASPSSMKMRR